MLPGKSHGRRSLAGCSPWGHEESDTTERLHFHFSLSCIGEGNGNPLQCTCLDNPRDGGSCWAALYGVAQSWTQLSDFTFTFHFHALEKEMATHSSVLAWRIPGTGEPRGLPSMGSHRVGHDWIDLAATAVCCYVKKRKQEGIYTSIALFFFTLKNLWVDKQRTDKWLVSYSVEEMRTT